MLSAMNSLKWTPIKFSFPCIASIRKSLFFLMGLAALTCSAASLLQAQTTNPVPVLKIQADQVLARVSPMLYGLMTEEINYSFDGGLYAELISNRIFKGSTNVPLYWQLVQTGGGTGSISLDTNQPINDALTTCLKLEASQVATNQRVGIANGGFWGIPVKPKTRYQASFYAKASAGFTGPLTVAIVSDSNATVYASAQVRRITSSWQKYEVTLTTGEVAPSKANHFQIWAGSPGTIWFNLVSLFPPTFNNRPNGNRIDIMQLLVDMKPAFLRFPGGNYLEGNTIATRFDWKKTLGDLSQRPGHMNDAWRYWSSDGMGLLEFLLWSEDLKIQPVLGVYAGYSLRGERVAPGPDLAPYVQDALEEIEYVIGGTTTPWGARRAKDGHPAPFKLEYVEVGNEDNLERGEKTYEGRFAQFYDAIRAKYPQLKIIASTRVSSRIPDVIDEHYYRRSELEMEAHAHDYDKRSRSEPKIFVGEYATRVGRPTPTMGAALGDAAWMTGMERNSDLVIMSAYAPLFVNVNPGGMQWPTDLIGYDALTSYGSPSYYAQKMFSLYRGDVVLIVDAEGIPTREWQAPASRRGGAGGQPGATQQVPTLFFNATRDDQTRTLYLKVVNSAGAPQPVRLKISGVANIEPNGVAVVMSANSPEDTNSITEPTKIVPVSIRVDGLSTQFTRTFPAYSITVLQMKGK
jgi:alpha-N-arabinofuranosidase